MPRIEIWKSTPSWRALSLECQRRVVQNLNDALNGVEQTRCVEEEGPFLIEKNESALLIWSAEPDRWREVAQLAKYFEPVASTAVNAKTTARTLASKLAG